jgi:ADP-ribose pyrophosphatase YjhB (NUDIX family)
MATTGPSFGHRWQVYAIVYDDTRRVLIAKKNAQSLFFHHTAKASPVMVNGGGKPAFPGGEMDSHTAGTQPAQNLIEAEAKKEFQEETGVALAFSITAAHGWDAGFTDKKGRPFHYAAAYFKIDGKALDQLVSDVTGNLKVAATVVTAIKNKTIKAGSAIDTSAYKGCPADNELESVQLWELAKEWETIKTWAATNDLNWYFNILDHLRANL